MQAVLSRTIFGPMISFALAGGLAAFSSEAMANDYPLDGVWKGRGVTSGIEDCPSFRLEFSVAGHHVVGKFFEGAEDHTIQMDFDVEDDGDFDGSFKTQSGHKLRISGAIKGDRWRGYLNHYVCKGSWFAERQSSERQVAQVTQTQSNSNQTAAAAPLDLESQLRKLQELRQKDLIDDATYKARRAALLDKLLGDSAGATASTSTAAVAPASASISAGGIEFGRYHALVIANNDYRDLPDLEAAIPDGKAVASLLRKQYGFEVELLLDANRYDIISALNGYRATLDERSNLLIYYAGHGFLDEAAEQGYWLPVDGESDNPANWVANSDITSAIRAISAKHVMLVVDSCYSGTLTRDVQSEISKGSAGKAWVKRMAGKRARTVLTSGGLEPVVDSGGDGHSVFAKAFLDALRANDDIMDGQSLFTALKRPVVVNAQQTPEYSDLRLVGHDGGDFLFVKKK